MFRICPALIARQLKEKKLNVVLGNSLCHQCVKKYNTILASKTESASEFKNKKINYTDERDEPIFHV